MNVLMQVIQVAARSCKEVADPKRPPNRADGLMAVIQGYARGAQQERTPIEVIVTIPASGPRERVEQPAASADFASSADFTVSPDSAETRTGSDGALERTIPAAIKRALLVRDKTCRFPGCSNRLFLDGHHIKHWADGGETSLNNLALLCTSCHARFMSTATPWR
jgi:HNH endonuclease